VGDGALIGMGAIVMDAAKIGEHSIVGAGSLVPKGYVVPPRTVVVGSPCRVIREVTEEEIADIEERCERYINVAQKYVKTGELL
jgi:carbonic anhydrase/acetyltransferase-like protein (isoleucine patch superfamily)